jgi:hypothetical protein
MALKNREDNTFDIKTPEEAKAIAEGKGGFLRSKWCGSSGVRAGHEGAGRRFLPLHAPPAVRHRGRMPRVRKEVHHRYSLGRGVLSAAPLKGCPAPSGFKPAFFRDGSGFGNPCAEVTKKLLKIHRKVTKTPLTSKGVFPYTIIKRA